LPPQDRFETIGGDELYRKLAAGEPLVLLDVRADEEFERSHIPGSRLIPLHTLEARIADVPNRGMPIAVVCEHGERSVAACRLLAQYGFGPLLNLQGGLTAWPGPRKSGLDGNGHHRLGLAPSSFLVENFALLPRGLALDLCMGEGRNAIYLATRGFDVDGVDARADRVARARVAARKLGAPIRAIVGNAEDGTYIIPLESYDVIVVFNYLHRPLFQDIREGLVPGGVVVYQAFTADPARISPPDDPERMLQPGELQRVFADWEILVSRDRVGPPRGGGPERAVAGIVARKPA
jgi:rhodanese-related sulfurtransferase